jgi:hypothetical protein
VNLDVTVGLHTYYPISHMTTTQRPDEIAHHLVTNVGSPVRVYLEDGRATIPVEPCRGGSPPTTTVPLEYFDAVIESAMIEDGGLTLLSMDGLHLPESEWQRTGLERHWRVEDADLKSPFFPPQGSGESLDSVSFDRQN